MRKFTKDIYRENFGAVKKQGYNGKSLTDRTTPPIEREIRNNRGVFHVEHVNGEGAR